MSYSVSIDAKPIMLKLPEDDFIYNLRILFVFYRMGSNLDQGRMDVCTHS
jgi:hypothetical protein